MIAPEIDRDRIAAVLIGAEEVVPGSEFRPEFEEREAGTWLEEVGVVDVDNVDFSAKVLLDAVIVITTVVKIAEFDVLVDVVNVVVGVIVEATVEEDVVVVVVTGITVAVVVATACLL